MNTLWNELNQRLKGTSRERHFEPNAIVVQRNEKNKKGEWLTFELATDKKLPEDWRAWGCVGWNDAGELFEVRFDFDVENGHEKSKHPKHPNSESALTDAKKLRAFVNGAAHVLYSCGGEGNHTVIHISKGAVKTNGRQVAENIAWWLRDQLSLTCDPTVLTRQVIFLETSTQRHENAFEDVEQAAGTWTPPPEAIEYVVRKKSKRAKQPSTKGKDQRKSPATLLLEGMTEYDAFCSDDRCYARIKIGEHTEVHDVMSKGFKDILTLNYFEKHAGACSASALNDAIANFSSIARRRGKQEQVFRRVARLDDAIYVDLCNSEWEFVEITKAGWKIVKNAPVNFIRNEQAKELPRPTVGGTLSELKTVINYGTEEQWVLICAWLLSVFNTRAPFPILYAKGEEGSGKTSLTRIIKRIVDPQATTEGRAAPRDDESLMIAGKNNFVLWYDNLSHIPDWLSESFCRMSTGAGFSKRAHYENTDEITINLRRPVIINSIYEVVGKSDLAQRTVFLDIPAVLEGKRVCEEDIEKKFTEMAPRLTGALYTALTAVLQNHTSVVIPNAPRMIDFVKWATAAEQALGFEKGAVLKAFTASNDDYVMSLIEGDPTASAIKRLVLVKKHSWTGTCQELLEVAEKHTGYSKKLPETPRGMASKLKSLAPTMRKIGIDIQFPQRSSVARLVTITYNPKSGSKATVSPPPDLTVAPLPVEADAFGKLESELEAWEPEVVQTGT